MCLSTVLVILVGLSNLALIVSLHDEVPYSVIRRGTGDAIIYNFDNAISTYCSYDNNVTFLVSERRCVRNEELFNDCSFAITASEEPLVYRLTIQLYYTTQQSNNSVESTAARTVSSQHTLADAVVIHQQNLVNSSICHISSLEVYRGREQVIKISHQGFILSDNGRIEIHIDQLAYCLEDYVGELYRMTLSCSGGGLRESGCLFFKVAGITDVSEAKFNCSVPGTLPTDSSECTTLPPTSPISTIIETTLIFTNLNKLPPTSFESNNNNILFTTPLVGGATIFAVSIATVTVCVVVWFQRRKSQLNSVSSVATQPQNQVAAVTLQPNTCQRNPAYIQLGPVDGSQADLVSGSYSENPAYNIDAQTSSYQEPTYEVIHSDTDVTLQNVQGTQNINCNQNPAYVCVGVLVEESFQADPTSPSNYSQNPAYSIHSYPN